jgi:hypothetical protein
MSMKIPTAPSGIEPETFRFVAQYLNQLHHPRTPGPSCSLAYIVTKLTLSNSIFLPPAYSPALVYFGRERGWWVTCNYATVLKENNINRNRKSTTCAICWLKSVLHEEKRQEQENHNVGRGPKYDGKGLR